MAKKRELADEVATVEEINEVDGQPIYHANEGEDESREENNHGKENDMH